MWLSRSEVSDAVLKTYTEITWNKPDEENQRSLEYILDAVMTNQFWNNKEQFIFNTFGFDTDLNKKTCSMNILSNSFSSYSK